MSPRLAPWKPQARTFGNPRVALLCSEGEHLVLSTQLAKAGQPGPPFEPSNLSIFLAGSSSKFLLVAGFHSTFLRKQENSYQHG